MDTSYDLSNLPEPLPAEEPAKTPQHDLSNLPSPLSIDAENPIVSSQPDKRGLAADLGISAVHGVESAVRETGRTALELGKHLLPPGLRDAVDTDSLISSDALTPKPETTLGKIESDVVRFTTGFLGAGAVVRGAGLLAGAAKSAISTGVTANAHAERLSNFVEEHTYLSHPVIAFMSAKEGDSIAEGKLKAAVEDLGLSAIGGVLFKGLKMAKESLYPKGSPAAAQTTAKDATNPLTIAPDEVKPELSSATADTITGLKLTPEHTAKLASVLDDIQGKTYMGSEVAADAANMSLLNTSKMSTSDFTKATLSRFGEVLGPIMKEQGWTESQTHVQTLALADEIGVHPDELIGALIAHGHDASVIPQTLVAGRKILQTQTDALYNAARKASITGEGKDEALGHLRNVSQTLAAIKMITTGAARATESNKITVGAIDPEKFSKWMAAQGGHDTVLQKIAMTEGDPTALAKLARSLDDKVQDGLDTVWKYHNTLWINGLLSSPKTQIVNAVSTGLNILVQPLNLVVGGTLRRDWADVREGVAIYKGLGTFLGDSFEMARKAFATETPVLGGNKTLEEGVSQIEGPALWAQALRFPTRLLGTSDEFFKQLGYRAKVSAQAAREGMDAVKSGHITEAELDGFISDKFKAAFDKDGAALNADALKYAETGTFSQSLDRPTWFGNFAEGISSLSSHPALRGTVLPFIRVPSNLLRQVMDYSPVVGQLRKKFLVDMQAGGSQASEALGRMTVGTGLWVSAGFLALNDKITGAAPRDPDLAAQLKATGWAPYSYVMTNDKGENTYISFNRFDPFASFLGLSADFQQIHEHLPEKKADVWAAIASLSLSNNLMSKSYLKGLLDTMSALAGNDPNRSATWIRQRTASYIPAVVGVAQPDTGMKELRTWMDGAMAKVPGLSATLESKRDIFGAKVMPQVGYPQSSFNPFPVTHSNADPVVKELARLAQSDAQSQFTTPHEVQGNIDLSQIKNREGRSAYDRLLELSGQGLKQAFLERMQSPAYQNGSDGNSFYAAGSRANMLRMIQQQHHERALNQVKKEYPALADALRGDKANRLDVKVGRAPRTTMEKLLDFNK